MKWVEALFITIFVNFLHVLGGCQGSISKQLANLAVGVHSLLFFGVLVELQRVKRTD